ncbi:MAG: tRNA (N(6)-L-threonylcarbamoyladenosine(37)-C(2))-methylthiotransferase MtaB [Acutalibacteraceae bacterium]
MKVAFYTLGCKVNQYETEAMREAFAAAGHTVVPDSAPFDAIVINSCTVTAESDRKTRQTVRRFRKERPDAAIILTGCMVQAFSSEAQALSEADIIAGNTDVKKIVEYAEKFLSDGERIFAVFAHKKQERFNTPSLTDFAERTRAYMKIEDGCERFCTYCIIPTARGFVRSKPLDEIKKEAKNLSRAGFSEIVLVGINLTSYGRGEAFDLADAVDAVCSVEGIKRVRLGSLEPDHMSDEMLLRFKKQDKFCPQFHLSLQSGCDETLKRMNRHYDTAFYRDLVARIRDSFENAAVTTDIMVGFAGETEEEFEKSLAFAREIGFAKAHIFAYSRRAGTVAYGLPNQVSNAEKARRSRLMSEATLKTEGEFLSSLAGRVFPVLFETAQDGFAEGYTANYSRVKVQSDKPHTGEILNVKIVKAEKDYCLGEFV